MVYNNNKRRWKKIWTKFRVRAKAIGIRKGKRRAVEMNHAHRWVNK